MAETSTQSHITQLATVTVPVTDQDRALEFYVGALGFEKRADFEYADGERWVEVAPRGGASQLTLVQARADSPAGVETGVAFSTGNIRATHADLLARGIDVDEAILSEGDPVIYWAAACLAGIPPMFLVRDPDGNSLLIVQSLSG